MSPTLAIQPQKVLESDRQPHLILPTESTEIRLTPRMLRPAWRNQGPIPCNPPIKVAVCPPAILSPSGFRICFQWSLIAAVPVAHCLGNLVVPKVKMFAHGCRHRLFLVMWLHYDLYLDTKVVEGHIVFDDYHYCCDSLVKEPVASVRKARLSCYHCNMVASCVSLGQ